MKENFEKKTVASIDLESLDGFCQWREIYTDGMTGNWERTSVGTDDSNGIARLRNEFKRKYGEDIAINK